MRIQTIECESMDEIETVSEILHSNYQIEVWELQRIALDRWSITFGYKKSIQTD